MTDGRTDGRTDRRTDGRTDGGDCNIPIAFLKKRGDNNLFSCGGNTYAHSFFKLLSNEQNQCSNYEVHLLFEHVFCLI